MRRYRGIVIEVSRSRHPVEVLRSEEGKVELEFGKTVQNDRHARSHGAAHGHGHCEGGRGNRPQLEGRGIGDVPGSFSWSVNERAARPPGAESILSGCAFRVSECRGTNDREGGNDKETRNKRSKLTVD